MARVPTWTELRLDATKLAKLQKECYRSVHNLLDGAIPELDRKLLFLTNGCQKNISKSRREESSISYFDEPFLTMHEDGDHYDMSTRAPDDLSSLPELEQRLSALNTNLTQTRQHTREPNNRKISFEPSPKLQQTKKHHQIKKKSVSINANGSHKGSMSPVKEITQHRLDGLEHLKPLPMPLSEYLKMNRPGVVFRANQRVMYLRKKAERRKQLSATRILNTLNRMKSSTKGSRSSLRIPKSCSRDSVAPDYQVKCKLSEQEMKRLTARIYKRLPEVKRQRSDEVTKHMRIQNYKNKMDYGRKLLENRRHGIINYPLRSTNDDSSIMSSQDDSLLSSGQSVDGFRIDAYY